MADPSESEFFAALQQSVEAGNAQPYVEALSQRSGVLRGRTGSGRRAFTTGGDQTWNPEYPYPQLITNTTAPERPRTVAAGYDPSSQIVMVTFREGAVYQYYNVPESVWNNFSNDPSPGRYIDDVLTPGYQYRRVREWEGAAVNVDTTLFEYRGGGWYRQRYGAEGSEHTVRGRSAVPSDALIL